MGRVKFDRVTGDRVEVKEVEVTKVVCDECGAEEKLVEGCSTGDLCMGCFLALLGKK